MDVIANKAFQVKVAREIGGVFAIQKPAALNGETTSLRALPIELITHILSFAFGQDNTFANIREYRRKSRRRCRRYYFETE